MCAYWVSIQFPSEVNFGHLESENKKNLGCDLRKTYRHTHTKQSIGGHRIKTQDKKEQI